MSVIETRDGIERREMRARYWTERGARWWADFYNESTREMRMDFAQSAWRFGGIFRWRYEVERIPRARIASKRRLLRSPLTFLLGGTST